MAFVALIASDGGGVVKVGCQRRIFRKRVAAALPNIVAVEGRLIYNGFRVRADGRESTQQINLFGLDPASRFLKPTLLQGRWLRPDDENSVVVNVDLLELEVGYGLIILVDAEQHGDLLERVHLSHPPVRVAVGLAR